MSKDWVADIHNMHVYYGFHPKVDAMDGDKLMSLLDFRRDFLTEELNELGDCLEKGDRDGIVDAIIDLCVVAIGTLDQLQVDANVAWDRVLDANMRKTPGIKESRPNPLGLPDLIKPEGWKAPTHEDNLGHLVKIDFSPEWFANPAYVPTDIVK